MIMLVACCGTSHAPNAREVKAERPSRIVSLDYCADQFALKLADRADIAALSPDATKDFSYLRTQAIGMRRVRPTAEDVLALKPDLIIRSYGGGSQATAFFEKAGVKVHQIGWGDDFDAVRTNVREAAQALGQSARGEEVVADFDARLAGIKQGKGSSALYVTSGGVTTGSGSMIDLMIQRAGLTNFQRGSGWNPLPLERLASETPDLVVTAFFGKGALTREHWSPSRHHVAQLAMATRPVLALDGATTACAGWFVMDSVEALAAKAQEVQP
jgi:iron complex transport system substrate-binding protein